MTTLNRTKTASWNTNALRVFAATLIFVGCTTPENKAELQAPTRQLITTASGLAYEIIERGTGPVGKSGDTAMIHETTQLTDGTMITDTWEMNSPIRFLLGGNQVIDGLDEAVTGMKVGERRKLIVPPSLSKRSSYPNSFSPEDTLYYDVVLLQISKQ